MSSVRFTHVFHSHSVQLSYCAWTQYSEREPTEFIQVLSSSNLTTWFLNLMFLSVVLGSSISGLPGLHLQMPLSGLHLRSPEWESLGTELEKASFVGSGTLALSHVHLCLFAYHWFPRTALVQSRCLINTKFNFYVHKDLRITASAYLMFLTYQECRSRFSNMGLVSLRTENVRNRKVLGDHQSSGRGRKGGMTELHGVTFQMKFSHLSHSLLCFHVKV